MDEPNGGLGRRSLVPPFIVLAGLVLRVGGQTTDLPKLTGNPSTNNAIPTATGPSSNTDSVSSGTGSNTDSAATGSSSGSNLAPTGSSGDSSGGSAIATITGQTSGSTSASGSGPTRIQSSTVSITGANSDLPTGGLNGLPKIGVSYPPVSVPNVADAPYMQHSSLPEGTVFIAVGAVLALFAFGILLWRAVQAYLLKRSVQRAAMAPHMSEKMAFLKTSGNNLDGGGPLLASTAGDRNGSTISLAKLRNKNAIPLNQMTSARRDQTPTTPLFFSPTAAASTPPGLSQNRSSSYLPAGYYASSAALPGGQPYQSHIPSRPGSRNQSMTRPSMGNLIGLGPGSERASASYVSLGTTATPPESPLFPPNGRRGSAAGASSRAPSTTGILGARNGPRPISLYGPPSVGSTSTLDLVNNAGRNSRAASMTLDGAVASAGTSHNGSRTPSAFLNDMFANSTEPVRRERMGEWRNMDLER